MSSKLFIFPFLTHRPPRKRPPGKLHQGPLKRKRPAASDYSSGTDNTSTTTTTTTSTTSKTSTTTSDTSGSRSHDTSGDQSHDTSGDQSHDTSCEEPHDPPADAEDGQQSSQQDMFGDNQDVGGESC